MTTKTIQCVECGESVPYGKLSCPSCGSLLASVSGQRGRAIATTETAVEAPETTETAAAVELAEATEVEPSFEDEVSTFAAEDDPVDAPAPAPVIEPLFAVEPDPLLDDDADMAAEPDPGPPVLVARAYGQSADAARPTILASLPSAYRPSTLSMSAAAAGASWSATGTSGTVGHPGGGEADGATDASPSDIIDIARLAEISGWFVVVGASMSILGFLLPWSVTVIGSRSFGGYFGSWGLASPTHVVVLLGLLAVLALGVLHTPVPQWIKTGILGLGMGGLLIGLIWPYVVGPLGADVGVLVTALGGISLVIGGVVASWATRHVEPESPV